VIRVVEHDRTYDIHDLNTGESHCNVAPADLPATLRALGVDPRAFDEARQPLTPDETDMLVMILVGFWHGLDRDISRRVAERWIAEHLAPSKRPNRLGLDYWRSCVEHDTHRYVPASIMRPALEANGIKVVGDRIYVKEVTLASPQRLRGVLRGHR
jgi:hypothetical protein